MKLTAVIISRTEKINNQIIDSISFADEIMIVVDSSLDKSKILGKTKIFHHPLSNNFAAQRNFALQKAKNDWVLFIDDDEYVSSELKREIILLDSNTKFSGFIIRRIDVCYHQPLLRGETGNAKILRLANKKFGKFVRPVHEKWQIKGAVGELESPLYHIKDGFISGFIERMAQYSEIDSVILKKENKPFSFWRLFLNPKAKFFQNYFFRMGFVDGAAGLFQAYLMSIQSLTVRVFQWTKRK